MYNVKSRLHYAVLVIFLGYLLCTSMSVGAVEQLTNPMVVINVPAFKLYIYDDGKLLDDIRIAIGVPTMPSPLGDGYVYQFLDHPVFRDDAGNVYTGLPKDMKSMGLHLWAWNSDGVRVSAIAYRIHSTSEPWVLGFARTHGCFRVARETMNLWYPRLKSFSLGKTGRLVRKIPVSTVYHLIETSRDYIIVYKDIYDGIYSESTKHDLIRAGLYVEDSLEELYNQLANWGIDYTRLDETKLQDVLKKAQGKPVPLDLLLHSS